MQIASQASVLSEPSKKQIKKKLNFYFNQLSVFGLPKAGQFWFIIIIYIHRMLIIKHEYMTVW